jgi:tripartite-type tricarboxylate transporter receptor subunit TctC
VTVWVGFMAPARTPAPVVDALHREISRVLAMPQVKQRIAEMGGYTMPLSPAQFGAFVRAEIDKWGTVVRQAGIKPE